MTRFNCSGVTGVVSAGILAFFVANVAGAEDTPRVDFVKDVRPILQEHCVECHGPSQQMNGLRLDRRRDVIPNRVGANRAAVIAGNSSKSPVYLRVSAAGGRQMPPSGPLRPEQINLLKLWIDQGADWPDTPTSTESADPAVNLIATALRNGDTKGALRTLNRSPKVVNAKGVNGWTPLMYASLYADSATVRLLLEKGADVNAQNSDGGTALMYAIDDPEKVTALLDKKADPNIRSGEGATALLIAAGATGTYSTLKILLERGADPKVRLPDGRGVLQMAVPDGDLAVLKLLLERGAGTKTVGLGGRTIGRCAECFDLLLSSAPESNLSPALTGALLAGDLPLFQKLLDRGAKPAANILMPVALSPAVAPPETIHRLISLGADTKSKTSTGSSVLELAKLHGKTDLVSILESAGVRDEKAEGPKMQPLSATTARAAVEKSIPALQRTDVTFLQKAGCVSCHNNTLTAMTVAEARTRHIPVDNQVAKDQLRRIAAFLDENRERALEHFALPGAIDTVSYILLGMAYEGYPSDTNTDAWARYIRNRQAADGSWRCMTMRPPLESSDFAMTAASIKSLRAYAIKGRQADYSKAIARGTAWLEKAEPKANEDHAFRVLGLVWGNARRDAIQSAAEMLLKQQKPDGGWSQTAISATDAYATGQALFALQQSKTLAVSNPAFQRGIKFLLSSQLQDGSWYVRSRAVPFQPYFDSDFSHGSDQFISAAATNWASMALTAAVR